MADLSRTDRQFLSHLHIDEVGDDGRPCWVYRLPRNRWQLVAWATTRRWERSPIVKNGRTLSRLEAAGLIEYGPDEYLPVPYQDKFGSTVRITALGRVALAGGGDRD